MIVTWNLDEGPLKKTNVAKHKIVFKNVKYKYNAYSVLDR